jgi:hypothetical protein
VLAVGDLERRVLDRVRDRLVEHAELGVRPGRSGLDERERPDVLALKGTSGDREVLDGALGLCPPERVARHLDLAHGVVLDPELLVSRVISHVSNRTAPATVCVLCSVCCRLHRIASTIDSWNC